MPIVRKPFTANKITAPEPTLTETLAGRAAKLHAQSEKAKISADRHAQLAAQALDEGITASRQAEAVAQARTILESAGVA
jgi:hypothetical protein